MTIDLIKTIEDWGIHLAYHELPKGYYGCSRRFLDSYLIIINPDIPRQKQMDTVFHELAHIVLGHFDYDTDKTEAEMEREVDEFLQTNTYVLLEREETYG